LLVKLRSNPGLWECPIPNKAFLFSFLAITAFLFPFQALAGDEIETSGRLRLDENLFLHSQLSPVSQSQTNLTLEYERKSLLSENWRFLFEPRLHLSSVPHSVDTPIDGDFRDTSLEGKTHNLHIQVGSFIKQWEGTDGANPMDIATVKSYRDPINSESLGSWGVSLSGGEASLINWEAFYVPYQTTSRLPGENSPWLPRKTNLPLESDNEQLLIPPNPTYEVQDHDEINDALKNNFGARLQTHLDNWDFALAGFEGAAQIPILQPIIQGTLIQTNPKTVIQMDNPIRLRPVEYRRRTIAGSVVSTKDSWVFRLAARHDQPIGNDPLLPSWSDQIVGGIEKTVTIFDQSVIFSLLYSHELQSDSAEQGVIANPDPYQRALLLGTRWPVREDLILFAGVLKDTRNDSFMTRWNLQKKLGDHLSWEGNLDWNQGPADTLFGIWQDQSRATLSTVYQF
jgi:hypothetical protein